MKQLSQWLSKHANYNHYLFTFNDLRALGGEMSDTAFRAALSRAVRSKQLTRVCRGLYLCQEAAPSDGLLLFHAAAALRAHQFNYISLETVLSEAGIISQMPMNRIFLMSSGRSHLMDCGPLGAIEFIHTHQKPAHLIHRLNYDHRCGLWRAQVELALRDMKVTRRSLDLIDWEGARAFIR